MEPQPQRAVGHPNIVLSAADSMLTDRCTALITEAFRLALADLLAPPEAGGHTTKRAARKALRNRLTAQRWLMEPQVKEIALRLHIALPTACTAHRPSALPKLGA